MKTVIATPMAIITAKTAVDSASPITETNKSIPPLTGAVKHQIISYTNLELIQYSRSL